MRPGDLWPTRVESYKWNKKFLKGSQAFSFRCAEWSWWRCSDALEVQQNQISQTQSSPTESNILDFSHKATFLFPKKTFQRVLLRIWNNRRVFFNFANTFPLKLRKKPITSLTACVSAQTIFHATFTPLPSLQGHHCCLTSTFSPHLQQLMNQSHGQIFWKSSVRNSSG